MTRESLLKDEWVKENFGDACYPNYLEPNFEAGVEYGIRETIKKACVWFSQQEEMIGISFEDDFIQRFVEAMEE